MHSTSGDRRALLRQLGVIVSAFGLLACNTSAAGQPADDPIGPVFALRVEELRRRIASLPAELSGWKVRSKEVVDKRPHFYQVKALDEMMSAFVQNQNELLKALKPQGNPDVFLADSRALLVEIMRSQSVWDFYREKLQLRFSPDFQDSLWVADIVAWNCYRPVIERAARFGILSPTDLREPPLCYYVAELSAATSVRTAQINDFCDRRDRPVESPIPVIKLPWEHSQNLWEFLSIPHEVGHDLEADLNLRGVLLRSLDNALKGNPRREVWRKWQSEVFADLVALQLVGPAYAETLMSVLLQSKEDVVTPNPKGPHPTRYLRILMLTSYIKRLIANDAPAEIRDELSKHAAQIEGLWTKLYDKVVDLDPYVDDFPVVFKALMESPFPKLNDRTVRSLIPYTAEHHILIRSASEYIETGLDSPGKGTMDARHCLAAARLAVTRTARQGGNLGSKLSLINNRTGQLVRENAPTGVLAADDDAHRKFISNFAKTIFVEHEGVGEP
jgi:hypothetical protein